MYLPVLINVTPSGLELNFCYRISCNVTAKIRKWDDKIKHNSIQHVFYDINVNVTPYSNSLNEVHKTLS